MNPNSLELGTGSLLGPKDDSSRMITGNLEIRFRSFRWKVWKENFNAETPSRRDAREDKKRIGFFHFCLLCVSPAWRLGVSFPDFFLRPFRGPCPGSPSKLRGPSKTKGHVFCQFQAMATASRADSGADSAAASHATSSFVNSSRCMSASSALSAYSIR